MKKLVLMAIATVFMVSIAFSGNAPTKVNTKKITNVIQRKLQYPAFAKDKQMEGDVYVNIAVDNKGKFKVNYISSPNKELSAYVLQELENMVIKDFKSYQTFDMKIVFKVEKI
ncbi:MAG: hypothetical protein AUJ97_02765 [Bacteroidetes bacterium CG2_30_32_10]|nr:MAG: hypothetical protein AUJ97_02765 [Bacteroidetes bacterium CG2_30_32_10]